MCQFLQVLLTLERLSMHSHAGETVQVFVEQIKMVKIPQISPKNEANSSLLS